MKKLKLLKNLHTNRRILPREWLARDTMAQKFIGGRLFDIDQFAAEFGTEVIEDEMGDFEEPVVYDIDCGFYWVEFLELLEDLGFGV